MQVAGAVLGERGTRSGACVGHMGERGIGFARRKWRSKQKGEPG